jgi:hypothetical protein
MLNIVNLFNFCNSPGWADHFILFRKGLNIKQIMVCKVYLSVRGHLKFWDLGSLTMLAARAIYWIAWRNFPRLNQRHQLSPVVDSNTTELFQFLSMVLVESIFEHGKELVVVTVGENVESTPLQEDLESLVPCCYDLICPLNLYVRWSYMSAIFSLLSTLFLTLYVR